MESGSERLEVQPFFQTRLETLRFDNRCSTPFFCETTTSVVLAQARHWHASKPLSLVRKLLGSVSYNLSTSSKCALSIPCTNRPFKCKMPGCNMYVWTYSLTTHCLDKSPRCRNVRRREESGVVEASRAHICQSIGGSIYQGYKNYVSHFDESYEKQRGNVHMCIGV